MKRRIKKNDLLPWFTEDHATLPAAYLKSTQEFFDSICWPRYYGGGPDLDGKIFRLKKPQSDAMIDPLQKINRKELKKL